MFQPNFQNPVELVWVILYHHGDIKNPSTVEFFPSLVEGFFEESCDLICWVVAERAEANPGSKCRVFVDNSVAGFEWVFRLIDQNPAGVFMHFSAHLSATIERRMLVWFVHWVFVVVGFVVVGFVEM